MRHLFIHDGSSFMSSSPPKDLPQVGLEFQPLNLGRESKHLVIGIALSVFTRVEFQNFPSPHSLNSLITKYKCTPCIPIPPGNLYSVAINLPNLRTSLMWNCSIVILLYIVFCFHIYTHIHIQINKRTKGNERESPGRELWYLVSGNLISSGVIESFLSYHQPLRWGSWSDLYVNWAEQSGWPGAGQGGPQNGLLVFGNCLYIAELSYLGVFCVHCQI